MGAPPPRWRGFLVTACVFFLGSMTGVGVVHRALPKMMQHDAAADVDSEGILRGFVRRRLAPGNLRKCFFGTKTRDVALVDRREALTLLYGGESAMARSAGPQSALLLRHSIPNARTEGFLATESTAASLERCPEVEVFVGREAPGTCLLVSETNSKALPFHVLRYKRKDASDGRGFELVGRLEGTTHSLPDAAVRTEASAQLLRFLSKREGARNALEKLLRKIVKPRPRRRLMQQPFFADKIVVATVVAASDVDQALNFACTAKQRGLDLTNVVFFAADSVAEDALKRNGLTVFRHAALEVDAVYLKILAIHLLSSLGVDILYQEPTVLWLGDFMKHLYPDKEDSAAEFKRAKADTLWLAEGAKELRHAPWFGSAKFFLIRSETRSEMVFQQLIYQYDLVLAWGSLQAVIVQAINEGASLHRLTTDILDQNLFVDTEYDSHRGGEREHPLVLHAPTREDLTHLGLWNLPERCDTSTSNCLAQCAAPAAKSGVMSWFRR